MNIYTFSSFEELQDSQFINTNIIKINNQGLDNTYEYIHLGSSKNRYIFSLRSNDAVCNFSFIDNHVLEWRSKTCYDGNMCNCFKFKAYGIFNNDINCWIQNAKQDGNKLFTILGTKFELVSIDLQINEQKSSPISGIKSDYSYCDLVMIPRQEMIRNINNYSIPYDSLIKTNTRNINLNQQYVCISGYSCGRTTCFIRFYSYDILEDIKDVSYIIYGHANISNNEFIDRDVMLKISYYENTVTDNHELEFIVIHNVLGDLKRNEIGCIYKIID